MPSRTDQMSLLGEALSERILIMDGAIGTEIQKLGLSEHDFRGEEFANHSIDPTGNNDLLCLTKPQSIEAIHRSYLAAGAHIVGTNTFNATSISQADYDLSHLAFRLNVAGAEIARKAVDAAMAEDPGTPRFVAGAIGPTSKTASISPDVNDPGFRNISFDELKAAYGEAARGLISGGADLLLVETIFDTLNAKAALFAIDEVFDELGQSLPIMVSGTITDLSGRTLSGQTVEAFWISVKHSKPFSVGLNCALGAEQLRPFLADLARVADTWICAYPNAGLPNEFGEYDESPEATADHIGEWARSGLLNIVGGCCGTTPSHIRAIAGAVSGVAPRQRPVPEPRLRLAGLEPMEVSA